MNIATQIPILIITSALSRCNEVQLVELTGKATGRVSVLYKVVDLINYSS